MLRVTNDFNEVEATIAERGNAVVYFTASWCGPCRALKPQYARASVIDADRDYFLVDVDNVEPDVLRQFSIQSVPRVFYIRDVPGENSMEPQELSSRKAQEIVDEVASAVV